MKLSKYPCHAKQYFGAVDGSELKYVLSHAISFYLQNECKNKEIVKDVRGLEIGTVPCIKCIDFGHYIIDLTMKGVNNDKRND